MERGNKDKGNEGPIDEAERPCQFCGSKELERVGSPPIWRCPSCGLAST